MLEAKPKNIFSWDFFILDVDKKIAELDISWAREKACFMFGGIDYEIRRDSILQGTFSLHAGDELIAHAQKDNLYSRCFQINYSDRIMQLKALQMLFRRFGLFEQSAQIGTISPAGWPGRKAIIDLPKQMPVPVQMFLFCLVAFLWRRAAADT